MDFLNIQLVQVQRGSSSSNLLFGNLIATVERGVEEEVENRF